MIRHKKMIYLNYTGIVDITPELGAILGGSPEAKTTGFGNSCMFRASRADTMGRYS